jgi:endonuclease III
MAKTKKKVLAEIISLLKIEYPEAGIQLDYNSEFELLVSTILSAQCTDDRVNKVTKELFKKYRSIDDFAVADLDILEKDIFSTGYYKAKARHIKGAANYILDNFNGKIPGDMELLLAIPGVGRKTANVVLGHAFGVPGIVVDTHVTRLANKLGLVKTTNAEKIEFELMKLIPPKEWVMLTHYFISHGRAVCIARRPKCGGCVLANLCPSAVK